MDGIKFSHHKIHLHWSVCLMSFRTSRVMAVDTALLDPVHPGDVLSQAAFLLLSSACFTCHLSVLPKPAYTQTILPVTSPTQWPPHAGQSAASKVGLPNLRPHDLYRLIQAHLLLRSWTCPETQPRATLSVPQLRCLLSHHLLVIGSHFLEWLSQQHF